MTFVRSALLLPVLSLVVNSVSAQQSQAAPPPPEIVEAPPGTAQQPYPPQGQTYQAQPAYPGQPYVYVQPYQAPAQVYVPAPGYGGPTQQQLSLLSDDDRELLLRGEYTSGEVAAGALLAILLGFGSGQAVQGRWTEIGWLFTFGEIGSIIAMAGGAVSCADGCAGEAGLLIGGAVAFFVLHIWEIVDSFATPASRNRRIRNLQMQLGISPMFALGSADPSGGSAGLTLRF